MADVYCDQSLGTGLDDGTDWTNAYKALATALNASNVVAGDTLWVKGNFATAAGLSLRGVNAFTTDPPQVIACKSATTATPPVQSDLIPGLRTGQSVLAYDDADAPTLTQTTAGADIQMDGWMTIYGLVLKARDDFGFSPNNTSVLLEECEIRCGHGEAGSFSMLGAGANPRYFRMKNCKLSAGTGGAITNSSKHGRLKFKKCILDIPASTMVQNSGGNITFDSCDFSSQTNTILGAAGGLNTNFDMSFNNCKINASSALVTGSILATFRTEFTHTSSATGKTTGQSFQEVDIITDNGDVVLETTRVRTGGADDGATGGWSLAYTPVVNGTRDNREGIIGPKMAIEVVGDGTAQTLDVFIANSSASTDYQDDEVWLVVKSPSATGTADYDFDTTQMDLLATPSNIADDTGSTWGSGANNHQKLSVSISPDYDGFIECWVVFAKNFGASPETLYVDPLPVLT